jgi:hypothetical protein
MKLKKPKKRKYAIRVRPLIRIQKSAKIRKQENFYKEIIADHGSDQPVIEKENGKEKELSDAETSKFYEESEIVTPEQKLFYSVLALGLKDYKSGCRLAWSWVWSNSYEIGDYLWTCQALNICPYKLRRLIKEGKIINPDLLSNITWTIRGNTLSTAYEIQRRKKIRQQKKKMTT